MPCRSRLALVRHGLHVTVRPVRFCFQSIMLVGSPHLEHGALGWPAERQRSEQYFRVTVFASNACAQTLHVPWITADLHVGEAPENSVAALPGPTCMCVCESGYQPCGFRSVRESPLWPGGATRWARGAAPHPVGVEPVDNPVDNLGPVVWPTFRVAVVTPRASAATLTA